MLQPAEETILTEHRLSIPPPLEPLPPEPPPATAPAEASVAPAPAAAKLTTSKLAKATGMKTTELTERLIGLGLLELREDKTYITPKGKAAGGEFRMSPKFGPYFLWPEDLVL